MNRIITGKCIDISSEGKGVVKTGKDIVFCDGLFIGEEAEIEIKYQRAGVLFGKVKRLISISKDRIQPRCKVCTSCGGCQFQQLNYDAQLKIKTLRVKNAIERIGHIKCPVNDCIGMKDPYNYRNKIQVPFGKDRMGNVVFGFYKENTHEIIKNKECAIENKKASPILLDIKNLINEFNLTVYNEDSGKGLLRYVLIRTSYHYDDLIVVLVTTQMNFPGQRNFINKLLTLHPEITTIVENVNKRHTNVILGEQEKVLYGKGTIRDSILGLTFEISSSSFYQVNPVQVETLYSTALNLINKESNSVVLDAYSGVGTIGLIMAKNAKEVISVEINKNAHRNAIENAKRNNIKNIRFYCDDASDFLYKYDGNIDVVIMDPPRSGSDEKFLSSVMAKKPKQVVYISCGPETLARDLAFLSRDYSINFIQPVDMFPFTSHVETIVGLALKK